jgi:hypothetical protein
MNIQQILDSDSIQALQLKFMATIINTYVWVIINNRRDFFSNCLFKLRFQQNPPPYPQLLLQGIYSNIRFNMAVEQINFAEAWKPQNPSAQQQQCYTQRMTNQGNFNGGPPDNRNKANGQGHGQWKNKFKGQNNCNWEQKNNPWSNPPPMPPQISWGGGLPAFTVDFDVGYKAEPTYI